MGKIVKYHVRCLDNNCGSSDARNIYEDGTSFCFSCRQWFKPQEGDVLEIPKVVKEPAKKISVEEIKNFPLSRGFSDRRIKKEVLEFFKVRVSHDPDSGAVEAHYYPYENETSFKIRELPKKFTWVNHTSALFGKERFNGAGRRLIITEGEIDALSVAQANYEKYGKIYPVVGLSSAMMTKSLLENRDWIRSFNEVILCLDNDKAGEEATQNAIKIIGIDKVKIAKLPHKDANEVLQKESGAALIGYLFDAAPYVPSGIINKETLWQSLENYNNVKSLPYPSCLEGVNTKLKGMRPGEITLLISGTGSGKSTIMREIMLHVLSTTSDKIGVVSLEESPAETARKLSGMVLNRNPAKEEIPLEELKVGFDEVFGSDRVVLLDHQGAMNDSSIVDKLEYMCLTGCKYLFIDHITILVSEGVDNLTGNEAQDKVMNDLLRLVKRHPVWIGLVSHLRKSSTTSKSSFEEGKLPSLDDIRGSGSIKQISFDVISFARDLTAANEKIRNTIKMRVLKSRYTGLTGTVKGAYYVYDTGRLVASDSDIEEEFISVG
jgi:twinkle protein